MNPCQEEHSLTLKKKTTLNKSKMNVIDDDSSLIAHIFASSDFTALERLSKKIYRCWHNNDSNIIRQQEREFNNKNMLQQDY